MLRIHVGRVLATILLIITALLVAAALRSHASGASDTTSLLGAPPAQLSLTPVEPPHPRTSGFNGTAWCGGLLQTKEADAADACTAGVVLLNLFVLLCCFLALAIICDDYLVPPIEHFCERYQIPDEAAGASFLAFGSSAPEIVIASIATLGGAAPDDPDGDETGLSTVLGSAVLAFGLIPGVSALLAPPPGLRNHSPRANDVDGDFPPELDKGGLLLEIRPLIRDVSFTIIGFSLIFLFGADGLVSRAEALALVGGFFVYMAVVFLPAAKQAKISRNEQASAAAVADKADCLGGDVAASPTRRVGVNGSAVSITAASDRDVENRIGEVLTVQSQHQQVLPTLQVSGTYVDSAGGGYGSFAPVAIDSVDRAERRRICAPPQIVTRVIEQLRRPIECVCEHTIPHEPEPGEKTTKWLGCFTIGWENNWYVVGFVVSLAYVSLLADVILDCVKFFGDAIGALVLLFPGERYTCYNGSYSPTGAGMSEGLEGVTILAWGAQVPDCLASVAMAKKGMGAVRQIAQATSMPGQSSCCQPRMFVMHTRVMNACVGRGGKCDWLPDYQCVYWPGIAIRHCWSVCISRAACLSVRLANA
jgi:Ca2+/Na+ antiporter